MVTPREQIENLLKSLDFVTDFHIQFLPPRTPLNNTSTLHAKSSYTIRIWSKRDLITAYDMLEKLSGELTLEGKIRKIVGKGCTVNLDIYEK